MKLSYVGVCSYLTALEWVCCSICHVLGSCVSVLFSLSVQNCFSSCHKTAFSADMDFVRLVSFQLRLPVIQHSAGEKLQAATMREKKVQYLNPLSLSHVQASICVSRSHVIIPFCLGVVPLLPASSFFFQLHCTTYSTEISVEVI